MGKILQVMKGTQQTTEGTTSDENNTTGTEPAPAATQETEENFNSYPHLLITEISPNSKGSTDYYEFFEVYNNSNQPILLNNYTFHYQYTDGSMQTRPFPFQKIL